MTRKVLGVFMVLFAAVIWATACGGSSGSTVKSSPSSAGATTSQDAVTATLGDPIVLNTDDGGQVEVKPMTGGAAAWTSPTTYERVRCLYIKLSVKNTGTIPVSDSAVKCSTLFDKSGLVYPALNADQKDEIGSFTLQPGERAAGFVYFKRTGKLKAKGRFPDFRYAPDQGMGSEFGRWTLAGYTIPKLKN